MSTEREGETTVLIVNDLIYQLELMSILFRKAGYRVLIAGDGLEAFEIARQEHPDLVISDVSMPRADGIELCRWIRADAALRLTPILLVSALLKDSESVVKGLEAGADDYLEVPYDPKHLTAKAGRLIERKRSEEKIIRLNEELERRVGELTAQLEAANKDQNAIAERKQVEELQESNS